MRDYVLEMGPSTHAQWRWRFAGESTSRALPRGTGCAAAAPLQCFAAAPPPPLRLPATPAPTVCPPAGPAQAHRISVFSYPLHDGPALLHGCSVA